MQPNEILSGIGIVASLYLLGVAAWYAVAAVRHLRRFMAAVKEREPEIDRNTIGECGRG